MEWFVYIIKSKSRTDKIYIGATNNLERRIKDHNRGNTKSTKNFIPWQLSYHEEYMSKKEALCREKQLKRWKNRKRIENLIKNNRP